MKKHIPVITGMSTLAVGLSLIALTDAALLQ